MSLVQTYRNVHWKQWVMLFLFWTGIAAFISTQNYFTAIKNGLDPVWLIGFRDQLPIWYFWALISPLILHIVNRFPISLNNLLRPLLIYLGFGLGLLFITTNTALVYMFLTHGYLDLSNTNLQEYSPYFFSRLVNDTQIYVLVLAVIIGMRAYGSRKKNELDMALMQLKNDQLQSELTKAQLQALKLQLNPHFLFNTLHTISSLTLIGENKASANVTTRLGDFLRRTLDFEENQLVSLSKELEFFDLYLEIESVRFKDRLRVEREIAPECLSIKVPNLLLQPIVENSVKHGIAKSKSAQLIKLQASLKSNHMKISIYNDGPPLNSESSEGIGVQNVQKRLEKLYGSEAGFEIKNELQGVVSILTLPIKENGYE